MMMGVETPIPFIAMDAATVPDFLTKIFSTAFGCPRRGALAADQSPKKENGNLPRCKSNNLTVLLPSHSYGIRRLGEALRRGALSN
jgi:hypothetical protein